MNRETKDQAQMSLLPGRFMGESLPSMDQSFSSLFCVVVTWLLRDDHVIGVNHWSAPEKAKRRRRKKRVKWVHDNLVVLWLILVDSRRKESECHSPSSMVRHQMNRKLPSGRQNPDTASHKANTKRSESAQKILFFLYFCDHYVTELQALFLYLSVLVEGNLISSPFLFSIEIGEIISEWIKDNFLLI